jgi:hypothetical protein
VLLPRSELLHKRVQLSRQELLDDRHQECHSQRDRNLYGGYETASFWADILPEGRGKQQARYACVHEAPLLVAIGL